MKQKRFLSAVLTGAMTVMLFAGCGSNTQADTRAENTVSEQVEETEAVSSETSGALVIAEQGIFSAGGTTIVSDGEFDPENQWEETGAGQTAHVDHANVLYQIPEEETGLPMVFLHGYGQSRMGWMTTPDGREGWSDMFLRKGHGVFLIDEPHRGEAGATSVSGDISTKTLDQRWYTQFRIGRWENGQSVVNEGSQFPNDENSIDQFFRQMTPDTGMTSDMGGDFDNETVAKAVAEKNIPITMYFGDYIDNGDETLQATGMWQMMRQACYDFADAYTAEGGNCTVVDLPKEGITGNDHFMFQDLNNDVIADHIENWIEKNVE